MASRSPLRGCWTTMSQDDESAIPLLSKLPIIGYLFRSKAERSQQTELMVLITPRLVRALNPDEVPPLPTKFKTFVPQGGVGTGMDGPGLVDAPPAAERRRWSSDTARQRPEVTAGRSCTDTG